MARSRRSVPKLHSPGESGLRSSPESRCGDVKRYKWFLVNASSISCYYVQSQCCFFPVALRSVFQDKFTKDTFTGGKKSLSSMRGGRRSYLRRRAARKGAPVAWRGHGALIQAWSVGEPTQGGLSPGGSSHAPNPWPRRERSAWRCTGGDNVKGNFPFDDA